MSEGEKVSRRLVLSGAFVGRKATSSLSCRESPEPEAKPLISDVVGKISLRQNCTHL